MTIYFSPEYQRERQEYDRLAELHGEDSPQAIDQFMKMFELAPQQLKDMAGDMAKEMGLIPRPTGYTDEGEPLYSVADMAKHFGQSESEVMASIDKIDPTHARRYTGNINRIQ